jgi:hypothetical protein
MKRVNCCGEKLVMYPLWLAIRKRTSLFNLYGSQDQGNRFGKFKCNRLSTSHWHNEDRYKIIVYAIGRFLSQLQIQSKCLYNNTFYKHKMRDKIYIAPKLPKIKLPVRIFLLVPFVTFKWLLRISLIMPCSFG